MSLVAMPSGPIERIFAEQRAMMDRMMAEMNAMFSRSANPLGTLPAKAGTFCEESISVSYNGLDNAPVVKVSRAGGGRGPETGAAPVPAETAPPAAHHPNVIEVNDPARVDAPRTRNRIRLRHRSI